MKRTVAAIAASLAFVTIGVAPSFAGDSISSVEGARAKERQGQYLNRQDREDLRRWGGNDDGYGYGYGYRDSGYYDGPGVSVYVGPRRGYGPYGY